MNKKHLLGKIFISYSSKDKDFVHKLAKKLEKHDYATWLDEKEIITGDYLPRKIGKAIKTSKIIIIVVSKNSISSKWVRYEINHAVDLMIKGKVRLIPVLIDRLILPPELSGLVFADFRTSFDYGFKKILKALDYEATKHNPRKISKKITFWGTIRNILQETFDSLGSGSLLGEYKSIDYDVITTNDTDIGYEIISSYGDKKVLSERWWDEFSEFISETGLAYYLLITKRPVKFKVAESFKYGKGKIMCREIPSHFLEVSTIRIIIIDLSDVQKTNEYTFLIKKAKEIIESFTKRNGIRQHI